VSAAAAEAIGHGLAAVLVDEVEVGRRTVRVSASIGLAMAAPGTTLDEVLSPADRAMSGAKEGGRGVLHMVDARNLAAQGRVPARWSAGLRGYDVWS
jgi:predicted signal transduction protein with EAL and GGDEF domain